MPRRSRSFNLYWDAPSLWARNRQLFPIQRVVYQGLFPVWRGCSNSLRKAGISRVQKVLLPFPFFLVRGCLRMKNVPFLRNPVSGEASRKMARAGVPGLLFLPPSSPKRNRSSPFAQRDVIWSTEEIFLFWDEVDVLSVLKILSGTITWSFPLVCFKLPRFHKVRSVRLMDYYPFLFPFFSFLRWVPNFHCAPIPGGVPFAGLVLPTL